MVKHVLILLLFMRITSCAKAQQTISLYADKIPNAIDKQDEEILNNNGGAHYKKVSRPTLAIYLPSKETATGTAVIICPGGGYAALAYKHEGTDVAEAFVKAGVAAFLLKYRLPDDAIMPDKAIGPLQDAQQAIKIIRQRAKEWGIKSNKIGIIGFSAGGHLASTAGTHFNKAVISNKENINLRPDFMLLIYPLISFTDSLAHMGSRINLLGASPSAEMVRYYSNELQVTKQTPPTFLVHARNDKVVKVENSVLFNEALKKNNVPSKLVLYDEGGHGFGMVNPTTTDRWMDHCLAWMKELGLMNSADKNISGE